jgi:hypothetical protein
MMVRSIFRSVSLGGVHRLMVGRIWVRSHGARSSAHEERLALIDVNYPIPRNSKCALFQVGIAGGETNQLFAVRAESAKKAKEGERKDEGTVDRRYVIVLLSNPWAITPPNSKLYMYDNVFLPVPQISDKVCITVAISALHTYLSPSVSKRQFNSVEAL